MGEKHPSFDRIIGGTEDQKNKLLKEAELESLKSGAEIFGEYLVNPNESEKIAIEEAVDYANKIASQYGAKKRHIQKEFFCLNLKGCHLLPKED